MWRLRGCLSAQELDNRWLVKVNSAEAADYLVREGFHLYNRLIVIRHYDDVLADEYEEYQEHEEYQQYIQHENRLKLMRQGLEDVALGVTEELDEDLI